MRLRAGVGPGGIQQTSHLRAEGVGYTILVTVPQVSNLSPKKGWKTKSKSVHSKKVPTVLTCGILNEKTWYMSFLNKYINVFRERALERQKH